MSPFGDSVLWLGGTAFYFLEPKPWRARGLPSRLWLRTTALVLDVARFAQFASSTDKRPNSCLLPTGYRLLPHGSLGCGRKKHPFHSKLFERTGLRRWRI